MRKTLIGGPSDGAPVPRMSKPYPPYVKLLPAPPTEVEIQARPDTVIEPLTYWLCKDLSSGEHAYVWDPYIKNWSKTSD